jgi:hypothetical protein
MSTLKASNTSIFFGETSEELVVENASKNFSREPTLRIGREDLKNLHITSEPQELPQNYGKVRFQRIGDPNYENQAGIVVTKGKKKFLCALDDEKEWGF